MPYTCSQCGAQNPDSAQFCYNCGAPAPAAGSPSPINLGKPGDANPYQTPSANPYQSPSYPQPPSNPYGAPSQPSPYDQQAMAPQSNPYAAPPAYGQTYGSAGGGNSEAENLRGRANNARIIGIIGIVLSLIPFCCINFVGLGMGIAALAMGFTANSGLSSMVEDYVVADGKKAAKMAMILGGVASLLWVVTLILGLLLGLLGNLGK